MAHNDWLLTKTTIGCIVLTTLNNGHHMTITGNTTETDVDGADRNSNGLLGIQIPTEYERDVAAGICTNTLDAYLEHECDRQLYRQRLQIMDRHLKKHSAEHLEDLFKRAVVWAGAMEITVFDFKTAIAARLHDFRTLGNKPRQHLREDSDVVAEQLSNDFQKARFK